MMKPPTAIPVPLCIMHAAVPFKMRLGEDGLEIVQVVSVGRKPEPETETWPPGALNTGVTLTCPGE